MRKGDGAQRGKDVCQSALGGVKGKGCRQLGVRKGDGKEKGCPAAGRGGKNVSQLWGA